MNVRSGPLSVAGTLGLYLVGVAVAVAGALGIVDAVALSATVGMVLFVVGLGIVLFVHERLGGPI
ncbi:hypothetical protein [Halovivax gelatinilyticus]|uniref:hypothetical protein n=1 Tax=Halovivax gelatinilyticus TaxID=2961597 RepID=UPI0020CA5BEC|nr:hypothetical protein [Halovivax gelatinilyticus]